ncbi:MAG: hypothetical protein MZV63_16610 [Marinilabiliales bacterium]|nr:hypothetical protein [Marinilabiliales bacterium]
MPPARIWCDGKSNRSNSIRTALGYIFGSAVVDKENTSGFGTRDNPPLVAVFTHHDPKSEKTSNTFQVQSIVTASARTMAGPGRNMPATPY